MWRRADWGIGAEVSENSEGCVIACRWNSWHLNPLLRLPIQALPCRCSQKRNVSLLKCGLRRSWDIPRKNAVPQQRPHRSWNSPIHHSGIFSISSWFRFFNQHMALHFINMNRHNPSIFIIMGFMATSLIICELIIAPPTSTHQF